MSSGPLKFRASHIKQEGAMNWLSAASVSLAVIGTAPAFGQQAQDTGNQALPSGFEAQPVLKTSETADGDPLAFPQTDKVEIVSVTGTIQPDGRTARHQHPVPVFVYVLEGSLEVQTEGKEARTYNVGSAFMESVNQWHQAFNKGDAPAKILVVFMGEQGKPTTVAAE